MLKTAMIVKTFLLAAFISTGALAQDAAERLHQLFEDEWAQRLQDEPLLATYSGVSDYDHRLPSVTPQAQARRMEQDRGFLARLDQIDRAALSEKDRLNYDLFRFDLESRLALNAFRPWRIPFVSDYGFYDDVFFLPANLSLRTVEDYENYIARLSEVPRYFDENISNMRTGIAEGFTMPRVVVEKLVPVLESRLAAAPEDSGLLEPFRNFPATIPEAERERLAAAGREVIAAAVLPAVQKVYDFFVEEYLPNARETLGISEVPEGGDYYAALVRYYTTLDMSPEQVHQLGLAEVERIRAEMEEVIAETGFEGTFAEFLQFLRTDPQFYAETPHQLLAEASYIAKRIDGQMPRFFGKLPRLPYGVKAVPDEIAPTYTTGRYWGGSLENGIAGFYMVNTYALDKRPLYNLPALTLHEGAPGHHHQIALTQEQEDVPEFRKNMYLSAFGEGWGLYAEKLGIEMGIYETPYQHFGRLSYEMWRAGRLVVDTGIHAMGWSREQAVRLFTENSALSTHNIETEVNRYISWPGQALAYKMGELKILELRERAEEALGENFDIRAFHDALLANGAVPLPILEQRIEAFIAAQQSE